MSIEENELLMVVQIGLFNNIDQKIQQFQSQFQPFSWKKYRIICINIHLWKFFYSISCNHKKIEII